MKPLNESGNSNKHFVEFFQETDYDCKTSNDFPKFVANLDEAQIISDDDETAERCIQNEALKPNLLLN